MHRRRRYGIFYMTTFLLWLWCVSEIVDGSRESQLRIGKAINIFLRYGYLGISMRVIPYNDSYEGEKWIFKEPTRNIYKNMSDLSESNEPNTPGIFHGDFHMEFCDNRRQLFQAYFRDFTIERLDRPWEAFTGGWFPDNAAKKLGINTSYILGDYAYVLVRVVRFRETGKLSTAEIPNNQTLERDVQERINQLEVGNVTSAVRFMEVFGTHYISSYTTGNSLYQVFVYSRKNYRMVKDRIKTKGINGLSKLDLYNYFAPWFAEHLGQIRSASANATVERWARRKLQYEYVVKYITLLKLHGNSTLLRTLDALLGNDAILQLDLKALNVIFREEPNKQNWFHEVLDNHMKLWEANMPQP